MTGRWADDWYIVHGCVVHETVNRGTPNETKVATLKSISPSEYDRLYPGEFDKFVAALQGIEKDSNGNSS